ncbi:MULTISPECIES: aldehyde dehydrogenase family protein [Ruegeria]|uniref:aldehyde dehydrogenase family protein n=1 Tax=Ruegeria TaxID=97050 RepID=UPI00147AD69F|nr:MULTISPECIES: aldehyde dehydrogenase family protein [Ruegeria]NOD64015.1 aldehyde dehydrogenase family protein [Ruegeria sp. HKCCD6109]
MTADPFSNYIAGTWAAGSGAVPNINPSDLNDTIGDYAQASAAQTADAIEAAAAAFPKWRATSPLVRFEVLDRIGSEILARVDELGDMLAREEGKTLPEAKAEAHRAGHLFKYFAAEAYRATGDAYQSLREGVSLKVLREPIGVVGVITPWNFPLAIPAWKIAPALAYGNTVVFKPAELVPGSAWMLSDIIARAGLPEGVFNLVMGKGREVGEAIVLHPKVSGVTFTGSTPVGRNMGAALFARGAKMQLEMGGKNPLVVLDDADLDLAVHCAIQGSFFSTGQRCTASSRLIVEDGIHDQFVSAMTAAMKKLRIGDARAPDTDIGPVASADQLRIDLDYIARGQAEGAELISGDQITLNTPGHYLEPALFVGAEPQMDISRHEIFGPIAAVLRVPDYEAALASANDCEFGLSAGIISRDAAKIDHFSQNAEAGMVQVNLPTAGMDFHAPFTGRKGSSYGAPEKGSYCREFFTVAKVVHEGRGQ